MVLVQACIGSRVEFPWRKSLLSSFARIVVEDEPKGICSFFRATSFRHQTFLRACECVCASHQLISSASNDLNAIR